MTARLAILSVVAAALAAQGPAARAADAPATITRGQGAAIFGSAVVLGCLASRDAGVGIAGLTSEQLGNLRRGMGGDLRPAVGKERFLYKDANMPVWTTDAAAGALTVAERSAETCEVVFPDLHVEAAFELTIRAARAPHPDFVSVPMKPGFNPIVYQLERVENGVRTIVHLEGAEPGRLFHTFRFSLSEARVIRQPESAKPPYR